MTRQLIAASEQRLELQAQLFACTPVTPRILFVAAGLKQQCTRADTLRDFCTIACISLLIPEGGMLVFFPSLLFPAVEEVKTRGRVESVSPGAGQGVGILLTGTAEQIPAVKVMDLC